MISPSPSRRGLGLHQTAAVITILGLLLSVLAPARAYAATPALIVATTSYDAESPPLGGTVTYTAAISVTSAAPVDSAIQFTHTVPTGVVPLSAYGTGWLCQAPAGRSISCTTSATTFAASQVLSGVTVAASVVGSGVTGAVIRSTSASLVQATGATSGTDAAMSTGALSALPTVTLNPSAGTAAGGNAVTVSGANIIAATVIQIGTTAEIQAGTAVVLNRCTVAGPGCFVAGSTTLSISAMPAMGSSATVSVLVATRGVATAGTYTYAENPAAPDAPAAVAGTLSASVSWVAPSSPLPITGSPWSARRSRRSNRPARSA